MRNEDKGGSHLPNSDSDEHRAGITPYIIGAAIITITGCCGLLYEIQKHPEILDNLYNIREFLSQLY